MRPALKLLISQGVQTGRGGVQERKETDLRGTLEGEEIELVGSLK